MTEPSAPARPRFYDAGIAFECIACGRCCETHGDYSYVYLADADIDAISAYLGVLRHELLERTCLSEDGWVFLKSTSSDCLFLRDGRCLIYPVRPKQCATWPFWFENLRSEETWNGPVRACCKGIGEGRLHSALEVESIARARDEWYR
ncbi:MAG: YkgJ family cysteine cluster protein [Myxococcota bacterium]|jgi:hypothetical protein|nr:YkgJ family cysteine cluster protein [Myxococcota bacterium]